jgi:anti-sigma factor RsiW
VVDPDPSRHAAHDTMLVAALAAGDLSDLARADGEAMVAACDDCATLHADLLAIATATHDLPAPVRTRDFRLSPRQAERLHPTRLRRALVVVGSPRSSLGRPLAVTFTTLGLAGLLLTALPAGAPGAWFGSSAGSERQGTTQELAPIADPTPGAAVDQAAGAADPSDGPKVVVPQASQPPADRDLAFIVTAPVPGSTPWLLVLSLSMLSIGLAILAARRIGRSD